MPRPIAALIAVALLACGGENTVEPPPPPPAGPLTFGIVSGQNQTVQAGRDSLTKPVMVAVVRAPSGRLVMRTVGDAQTVVTGSPVPGAVICAHPDSLHPLVPWVQCTNTDSTGHAPMWFNPGVKAGHPSAEIRGSKDGQPAVFDTVVATVLPGPAASMHLAAQSVVLFAGQSYAWRPLVTAAADQYGNATATDSAVIAGDTLLASEATGSVHYSLGTAQGTVTVTALDDLSGRTWTLTTRCAPSNGGPPDSVIITHTSQPAAYVAAPPLTDSAGLAIPITATASIATWTNGAESVATGNNSSIRLLRQFADSVQYFAQAGGPLSLIGTAMLTETSPRTYEGGSWCDAGYAPLGPVTITATP